MRNRIIFFGIFVAVYGSISYYVGLRGFQWLNLVTAPSALLYWLLFWVFALAFPLSRFGAKRLPLPATRFLATVGAFWLFLLMYLLPLLLLVQIGGLFVPTASVQSVWTITGGAVALLLLGAVLYGVWRARRPVVVSYEVTIPKPGQDLHIVLVSDTHFGMINGTRSARQMVDMINALKPDLVLHGGDLIDDDIRPFMELRLADELKQIKSRLGVFGALGNHDYGWDHPDQYRAELDRAGIRLLVDEVVKVADSFYIIGRDDLSGRYHAGRQRAPLDELLQGVDKSLPLILIDHQPSRLAEAAQAGVDLMLCGHTHRGQMFPNHLITRRVFEVDWGYLKKGAMHVIVSLGFGTWGPPVRLGNTPEVVSIRVRFTAK